MTLINAEQAVLRVLGFEVDVAMPFNFLFSYAHQNRFVKLILSIAKLQSSWMLNANHESAVVTGVTL